MFTLKSKNGKRFERFSKSETNWNQMYCKLVQDSPQLSN